MNRSDPWLNGLKGTVPVQVYVNGLVLSLYQFNRFLFKRFDDLGLTLDNFLKYFDGFVVRFGLSFNLFNQFELDTLEPNRTESNRIVANCYT